MNREWSRGGEPLRSREGYSELTEDWRKLFGGYLDPSSLVELLSGRSERRFQGALNGTSELSSSWPFLKALSSCGDGGVLKQVKLTGRRQRSPRPAGASGKNESRKSWRHCVGPTHKTAHPARLTIHVHTKLDCYYHRTQKKLRKFMQGQ